jgi:uncharacterized membrane protein YhdT
MSNTNDVTVNYGMGIGGWLTVIFVIAKLTGYIDWSWWLVFAALWIPALIVCAVLFVVGIIYLIALVVGK